MTASYTCPYHRMWWAFLHLNRVVKTLTQKRKKKQLKIRNCAKLQIRLKREISHGTRRSEIVPTTKHMLRDITRVSSAEFVCRH
jgi:hypothetical protein